MKDAKVKKIIFLCTGNICRSPMAEALLKHAVKGLPATDLLHEFEIISAGTAAIDGLPMSANSERALAKVGIELPGQSSKLLTKEMLDDCFALFGLERSHLDAVSARFGKLPKRSITVKGTQKNCEDENIADPYGGNLAVYENCRDEIATAIPSIIKYLKNEL